MKVSITICDEAIEDSHAAEEVHKGGLSLRDYEHATDALIGLMEKIAGDPCFSKLDAEIQKEIDEAMLFKELLG